MNAEIAIERLLAYEIEHGTEESLATAYALAIGVIPPDFKTAWLRINRGINAARLDRVKVRAWQKYDAIKTPNALANLPGDKPGQVERLVRHHS